MDIWYASWYDPKTTTFLKRRRQQRFEGRKHNVGNNKQNHLVLWARSGGPGRHRFLWPCFGRLINAGADVNVRNKFGATPLIMASQNGHAEVVKLLLAAGADVNARARKVGEDYTALRVAKIRGHTRVIKLLKEHGAKD